MVMTHESAHALEACPPSPSSEGTWLVKTSSGVHTCTLDELDLAFERGQIDASTPVFTLGMTEWQTLGVVADLDAPAVNDTVAPAPAAPPAPSGPRNVAPPPRPLPSPPSAAPAPPRRVTPPPLADGQSFPPTSTAVFGSGASVWASITPPAPDLQTGVRRNAAVVPFAVRRTFGGVFDFTSNFMAHLRAVHPRFAAVGPWVFGAGLSGILVFALYQLANAPPGPGAHTRSGPVVSYAAASATVSSAAVSNAAVSSAAPSAREPAASAAPSALSARLSNGGAVRPVPGSPAVDDAPRATTRAASMPNDDGADGANEGSDVLRTHDLKVASNGSERQVAASGRSKAKAKTKSWSKRSKARKARKARRTQL